MQATAKVRHIRMSPRKLRVVADMVRGEPVESAMATLRVMPKKAARIISKALVSAAANAEDKAAGELDTDALYIKAITVDGGPIIKRWMPRAMGRANRINHRTSHLTVVVSDEV
ncbi:MAG: 50S ribosomal protein L22 [Deltaproteobacteria bacterium]|nr:MAG: 50S ribosomal protein L22 [Deltaproteobacteria bacterium]